MKAENILKIIATALLLTFLLTIEQAGPAVADAPQGNDRFGLCFISAAEDLAGETRYDGALATGARWDRWPLYWHWVNEGGYVGSHSGGAHDYDELVIQEIEHGLTPIVILMGTPDMRATAGSASVPPPRVQDKVFPVPGQVTTQGEISTAASPPVGLFEPIFADGTDIAASGKVINQSNSWAVFVATTVDRYKPGGILATWENWEPGVGVRYWEIWNEQDLDQFWSGTVEEYHRLLEVAYQTIKFSDPGATVILGALAFYEKPDWLSDQLALTGGDPAQAYFDVLSYHYYWSIYHGEYWMAQTRAMLDANGLSHVPIWITESGVLVWDDFPATEYGVSPDSPFRSTMEEQAAYVIQNAALAFYNGVERYYHFMLHDDCGNTLPDAFGLRQNLSPHVCNPAQGKPRLAYAAYQLAAEQYHDPIPLWREKENDQDRVALYREQDESRLLALWATGGVTVTATVSATGEMAHLYWIEPVSSPLGTTGISRTLTLTPTGGVYTLTLSPATNQNFWPPSGDEYFIGGRPYLLVERDTLPPTSSIEYLPPISPQNFEVHWGGKDLGSGIASYDVWVNEDGGTFQIWMTKTTAINATFIGVADHTYGFAVCARDHAGNQEPVPLVPQATTMVVPGISMSGVVLGADGKPVAGATVTVGSVNIMDEFVADDDGLWSLVSSSGEYAFNASADGHGTWPAPRHVIVSESSSITLTLAPLTSTVTAGDFEGSHVWDAWTQPNGNVMLSTDAFDGRVAARLGSGSGWPMICFQNGQEGELWTLKQTVAVPSTPAPALSFLYTLSTTQTAFDHAWLEVALQAGSQVHYLVPWGKVWQNTDWTLALLDLAAWRGQTVDLIFQVANCSDQSFIATLDRVSVGDTTAFEPTDQIYLPLIRR